jgi:hypothetical protein
MTRFLSTPHRVLNSSGVHRYSIAFFFGPALDSVIKFLPSCVSTAHPARYRPARYRDLIHDLLSGGVIFAGDEEITTSIFLLSAPSWWTPEDDVCPSRKTPAACAGALGRGHRNSIMKLRLRPKRALSAAR